MSANQKANLVSGRAVVGVVQKYENYQNQVCGYVLPRGIRSEHSGHADIGCYQNKKPLQNLLPNATVVF